MSAAALAEEPEEWLAQVSARLRNDKSVDIRRVIEHIAETRDTPWLRPILTSLIPAGGPVEEIVDVGAAYDDSPALIWSQDRTTITAFSRAAFHIWDLSLGREIRRLNLPIEWGRAAISDPPHRAVVMASQSQLLVVNLKTAKTEVIFNESVIENVAISANGMWAITSSVPADWDYFKHDWNGPRTLRLFDLHRRRCVRTWQAHRGRIEDLALSADGRFLATASRDQTAQLFDLHKGDRIGRWRNARGVAAVAMTPNGQRIAYVSDGGVLTVRQQDGKIIRRSNDHDAEPRCLALSQDGKRIVMAGASGVSIVDLRTSKRFGPLGGSQPNLMSPSVDKQARHAITGELGRQLLLWDLTKVEKPAAPGYWISGMWASKGQALVHDDRLSQWDLSTGSRTKLLLPGNFQVASSPSAGIWAVARWASSSGGRIRIGKWGQKQTTPFASVGGFVNSVALSRNGTRLVATVHLAPHRDECRVWDVANQHTVWHLNHLNFDVKAYISPSGRYLLLCSVLGRLGIVDLDTGEFIERTLPQPNSGSVLFTSDDDCILVPQGYNTLLLNWRSNAVRKQFSGTPSSVSEDGLWMVTESNSRKLTLWFLPEERRIATYTSDVPILHSALSADGQFLIAGDQTGNVHILRREGSI